MLYTGKNFEQLTIKGVVVKKIFMFLVLIILVVVCGVIIARNTIAKNAIMKGTKEVLGQDLTIGDIDIGLLTTNVKVNSLQVYNPKGYTEKYIADVNELFINYSLLDILKGFIHFPEIRVNIEQLNIEKDKNGVLNVDHFKPESSKKQSKEK